MAGIYCVCAKFRRMDVPAPSMDHYITSYGYPAPVFLDNGATSLCSKPVIATTNALEAVVRWYAACPYSLPAQRAFCSHARPNWQLALLCMEQDSVADQASVTKYVYMITSLPRIGMREDYISH